MMNQNTAAVVLELRDTALKRFPGEDDKDDLDAFLFILRECYNSLDDDNDYDLDIG